MHLPYQPSQGPVDPDVTRYVTSSDNFRHYVT